MSDHQDPDLAALNGRIAEVIATNQGTIDYPLWLDIEFTAAGTWSVYIVYPKAAAHAPLNSELIHRGEGPESLELWLRDLESYGDSASIFIAATRVEFLDALNESIRAKSFGIEGAANGFEETFGLEVNAYHFADGITEYHLSHPSDEYGSPVAGFLSVQEVEAFIAKLEANPAESYAEIDQATANHSEARALGWGDYVGGEIARRRIAAQRAASMQRHPAGKSIAGKVGALVPIQMGTDGQGQPIMGEVRSIFGGQK